MNFVTVDELNRLYEDTAKDLIALGRERERKKLVYLSEEGYLPEPISEIDAK